MLNSLRKPTQNLVFFIATPFSFIHPNVLTLGSFLISIPGFYFLYIGNTLLGSLFILGALFDMIDGAVAKKTGKVSKFGGVWDATLDRIYEGILIIFIGMGKILKWEILVSFLIISFAVSYVKAKAEAVTGEKVVGVNQFSKGFIERGERIIILFIGMVLNGIFTSEKNEIFLATIIFLSISSFVTFLIRTFYIYKVLK